MYTGRLGPRIELDIWAEVGILLVSPEAELNNDSDWLVGTEWSFHRWRVVPYFRPTVAGQSGGSSFHPLGGLMVPLGDRVELHAELSGESPERGPWPVHLAFGPNVRVGGLLEILPEVSMLHDRGSGETAWQVSFGLVLDPRELH